MSRRITITSVVHVDGTDDVLATGAVQGYEDAQGQPIQVSAHVWKSHLDQQPTNAARRRAIAIALDEAVPRAPRVTALSYTGDVDI